MSNSIESPAFEEQEPRRGLGQALVPLGSALGSKGRASVVRATTFWYIAALSSELKKKPIARTVLGLPMVLFRDGDNKAGSLLDRCPHRNVPLSLGEVVEGQLQCPYHGWRFDGAGECRFVPSLVQNDVNALNKSRRAPSFPTIERDGFVWVYPTPRLQDTGVDTMPTSEPHVFEYLGAKGYSTVKQVVQAESTLYSALENALDVPHTAYLHRGLFRSKSRGIEITAKIKRTADRVEAEYIGEPRPTGLVARILSPSGGMVTHYDRFILPSIAQVEYRIGTENHLVVDTVMTPITDFVTKLYAVVSFKTRIPSWLIRPFVKPLALKIFQQDAFILKRQSDLVRQFGGEQFTSTEIDVLGRHILRLLKAAERGGRESDDEGEIRLIV